MAVFISYSHRDASVVAELCTLLVAQNIKIWRDVWQNLAGDEFTRKIHEAIAESSCFCVFVSGASLASTWVQAETAAAVAHASCEPSFLILPVLLDESTLPGTLADRLFVDYRGDPQAALAEIVRAVQTVENRPPKGSVNLDASYYIHYGIEDTLTEVGYHMELDVVSFDTEEIFSVLSQFDFTARGDGLLERFGVPDARGLRDRLLAACAEEFAVSPAVIQVTSAKARRGRFVIQNSDATAEVNVTFRIATVGTGPRRVLLFNGGALFDQVCTSSGIDVSHHQRTRTSARRIVQQAETSRSDIAPTE